MKNRKFWQNSFCNHETIHCHYLLKIATNTRWPYQPIKNTDFPLWHHNILNSHYYSHQKDSLHKITKMFLSQKYIYFTFVKNNYLKTILCPIWERFKNGQKFHTLFSIISTRNSDKTVCHLLLVRDVVISNLKYYCPNLFKIEIYENGNVDSYAR